jgi:hypothetical protein
MGKLIRFEKWLIMFRAVILQDYVRIRRVQVRVHRD